MRHANVLKMTLASLALFTAAPAFAGDDNPECLGSSCGKPKEEGGGCGCGCGCSVWVAYTDDGKTLAYTDDADGDGKADDQDNCPFASNRDQADGDGDGIGNSCDNCASASNVDQKDTDGDSKGDVCEAGPSDDKDGDGFLNSADKCPDIPNPGNVDTDGDGLGDSCDPNDDNDAFEDGTDKCPLVATATNVIPSDATVAAKCSVDSDGDNVSDGYDKCPLVKDPSQLDKDNDGLGDACDPDQDDDGVLNASDNCSLVSNRDQLNDDGDKLGDKCDPLYCVVVDPSNEADCLNPRGPFQVHGGGFITLKKGEKFRLPLFANRNGAAIDYTWTVVKRPAGSTAAIENPIGAVSMSRHWEYAYTDGNVPSFTADQDGDFELQLKAKLAFDDRGYPGQNESISAVKLGVSGLAAPGSTPAKTGCAAIPAFPLVGLGLAVLALRRRRA